ncbi:MAG: tRNA epoxyqueuosine(34) reductase QueG [Saprospiraceae bacterium]|nr:tRNA epoxyqueuosine(34) reductase QueG [Saprospiraceae bacterium]
MATLLAKVMDTGYQEKLTGEIHAQGFDLVGYAALRPLKDDAVKLRAWLDASMHAGMDYLARHFEFRTDPETLVPGSHSVIALGMNHYNETGDGDAQSLKIARYASGVDYHKTIRKKLKQIVRYLKETGGARVARGFVDSGPVLERVWAREAGIAWNGKNTLSINPRMGSYFFLACIFTDLEFNYGNPIPDHCGRCRRCIDACPTEAIHPEGHLLDAGKCISYLTIEHKGEIPDAFRGKWQQWIFGCDICQEVCPWNRFSRPTMQAEFQTCDDRRLLDIDAWLNLTEEEFQSRYGQSALVRKGLDGIQKTARFLRK